MRLSLRSIAKSEPAEDRTKALIVRHHFTRRRNGRYPITYTFTSQLGPLRLVLYWAGKPLVMCCKLRLISNRFCVRLPNGELLTMALQVKSYVVTVYDGPSSLIYGSIIVGVSEGILLLQRGLYVITFMAV